MPAPPPETPHAVRTRAFITLSFWAVIVLLGIPTWLYTTSIERAALPVEQMLAMEHSIAPYSVQVRLSAPGIPCQSASQLVHHVQTTLNERNEFPAFHVEVRHVSFGAQSAASSSCDVANVSIGEQESALDVELHAGNEYTFDAQVSPVRATYAPQDSQSVASKLADSIRLVLLEEQTIVAHQYVTRGDGTPVLHEFLHRVSRPVRELVERRAARAFKASPSYHLTFSLFTASGTPSSWDVQSALERFLKPLVHSLAPVAKVSITTQIQLYSALSPQVQPFQVEDQTGWFLQQRDLTAFINTAEWPLSPSIGLGPTINFVAYVPEKRFIPLRVSGSEMSSWIVPQWGGITILSPPSVVDPDTLVGNIVPHLDDLQDAFGTFQSQLLLLLGVPSLAGSPLPVRLRAFQRLSGLALYLKASSNLGSLARISEHLGNIPIPHHVSDLVQYAVHNLELYTSQSVASGVRSLSSYGPKAAFYASEKAFFDKSMVGQVYFPDEHKVAVYLPLLGPIGVPLVVSLVREAKQFWRGRGT